MHVTRFGSHQNIYYTAKALCSAMNHHQKALCSTLDHYQAVCIFFVVLLLRA